MPPNTKTKARAKCGRPTHFLCFPLATDDSVPQLADSLAYFRSVTTPLEHASLGTRGQEGTSTSTSAPDLHGSHPSSTTTSTSPITYQGIRDETLRLLPSAAHRPPGTFHLTLGTMDLSEREDMDLAIRLLEQIDYVDLLRAAEAGELKGAIGAQSIGGPEHGHGEVEADSRISQGESKPMTVEGPLTSPPQSLTRKITPPPPTRADARPKGPPASDLSGLHSRVPPPSSPTRHSPTPLRITLSGLGTFPQPSSSRVFYAHPHDATSRLLAFGDAIRRIFQEAGLITETRALVLHATVANMIYVKDRPRSFEGQGRGRGRQAGTVDARDILRYFNEGPAVRSQHSRQTAQAPVSSSSNSGSKSNSISTAEPSDSAATTDISSKPGSHRLSASHQTISSIGSKSTPETDKQFIWARDIEIDRIRICKMGADRCDIEGWEMEYKHIAENVFFS
ncbi:hypothetical protein A1O3_09071 [Capronia epimyces CBS 606.96]|uniref:A-kinase anchor protein 7-like phosphoesterase domain-containing protein n=1 Tax=Capronia epimyces CBS 606.96 TaxID=1182542 RepID=W9XBR8_9EURO|nr:uncharacterized protein A1O3_09071 [Capronia epimyces CBS 606.96]EXJ77912.1 hypothetical protein A1O3_09071 [Capronia epimyces CBS 606.96]